MELELCFAVEGTDEEGTGRARQRKHPPIAIITNGLAAKYNSDNFDQFD